MQGLRPLFTVVGNLIQYPVELRIKRCHDASELVPGHVFAGNQNLNGADLIGKVSIRTLKVSDREPKIIQKPPPYSANKANHQIE